MGCSQMMSYNFGQNWCVLLCTAAINGKRKILKGSFTVHAIIFCVRHLVKPITSYYHTEYLTSAPQSQTIYFIIRMCSIHPDMYKQLTIQRL